MDVSQFFRLTKKRATEIIEEVLNAVGNWKEIATNYGMSRVEQELKSLAFKTKRS